MNISVIDITNYLHSINYDIEIYGNQKISINGFCSLNNPRSNSITWVKKAERTSLISFKENDSCIVVAQNQIPTNMKNVCFLLTQEPKAVFFSILKHFFGQIAKTGIAKNSVVETKKLGQNISIGNNCYIGPDVTIEDNTVIEHNVTIINKTHIGKNCFIHSGVRIGTDGFGYYFLDNGQPVKVEHFGGVCIGDDVEIGSNTCIDRGTVDDTFIGSHTKIDNLVHIAHNVSIGQSSLVIAGAILCGSVKLGETCYIAPGGIIKNQLTLENNAYVGLGGVVTKPVDANTVVIGVPAKPIRPVQPGDK